MTTALQTVKVITKKNCNMGGPEAVKNRKTALMVRQGSFVELVLYFRFYMDSGDWIQNTRFVCIFTNTAIKPATK